MIHFIKNNKIVVITTISMCIVTMLILGLYSLLQKDIIVKIDDEVTAFKVTSNTVEELLYQKDIKINNEDYISHELSDRLEDGMEIIIKKAVPVTVYYEESKIKVKSLANNVRELIDDIQIEVDENDIVFPPLNHMISENSEITIIKVEEIVEVLNEDIPFKVIQRKNDDLIKDKVLKIQDGEKGLKEIKIKKRFENGQLVSEVTESSKIVKHPIDEIIEKGTKEAIASSRGMITYEKSIEMVATAYDLSYESTGKRPGDKYFGITASGTKARPGVVAVDPKVIPLGTKLYIKSLDSWPDYGFAVAEDTGGAIKGNKIDLFMESHSTATRFGRRKVKVYILD